MKTATKKLLCCETCGCVLRTDKKRKHEEQQQLAVKIKNVVAEKFDISVPDLERKSRMFTFALARHMAMNLIHQMTELNLVQIGAHFRRDHGTVCHAISRVSNRMNRKEGMIYDELKTRLIIEQTN